MNWYSLRQVFLPFTVVLKIVVGDVEKLVTPWPGWGVNQFHISLFSGFACLSAVAIYTGTNYILPDVLTASISRDNVV